MAYSSHDKLHAEQSDNLSNEKVKFFFVSVCDVYRLAAFEWQEKMKVEQWSRQTAYKPVRHPEQ